MLPFVYHLKFMMHISSKAAWERLHMYMCIDILLKLSCFYFGVFPNTIFLLCSLHVEMCCPWLLAGDYLSELSALNEISNFMMFLHNPVG